MLRDLFVKTAQAGLGPRKEEKYRLLFQKYLSEGKTEEEAHQLALAELNSYGPRQDGTGPHGRGLGPGQGRADGTGLAKK